MHHFSVVVCGGIAQLARAFGSYPKCHRFESSYRYHSLEPHREVRLDLSGLFVKWLRHRPFTAGSRVRIPYRSPKRRRSSLGLRRLFAARKTNGQTTSRGGTRLGTRSVPKMALRPRRRRARAPRPSRDCGYGGGTAPPRGWRPSGRICGRRAGGCSAGR